MYFLNTQQWFYSLFAFKRLMWFTEKNKSIMEDYKPALGGVFMRRACAQVNISTEKLHTTLLAVSRASGRLSPKLLMGLMRKSSTSMCVP